MATVFAVYVVLSYFNVGTTTGTGNEVMEIHSGCLFNGEGVGVNLTSLKANRRNALVCVLPSTSTLEIKG